MDVPRVAPPATLKDWSKWPETFKALRETYFAAGAFGAAGEIPANGNYMLAGLAKMSEFIRREHAAQGWSQQVIDRTAAHEIFFLWNRGRKFNRPAAALSTCLYNLALERPERFMERAARAIRKNMPTSERTAL